MIPTISSEVVRNSYIEQVARRTLPLESYSLGGEDVGVSTSGDLNSRQWKAEYVGPDVVLTSEGKEPLVLFSRPNITHLSFCFDQAMRPYATFVQAGAAWFWWYNTETSQQEFLALAGDVVTPYLVLDDKRELSRSGSDVILSYMRNGNLYCRVQRERFLTEHLLYSDVGGTLTGVGLNKSYRLQWRFKEN